MSQYKLIAFDMDGTLLDSEKKITPKTVKAIKKATDEGKIVILNTGRCPAELEEYYDILPTVRYLNCLSGALVYDLKEDQAIYTKSLKTDEIKTLIEIGKKNDEMVHLMSIPSIVEKDKVPHMEKYGMGVYQPMYERVTTKVDDIYDYFMKDPFQVEKLNIYHKTPEERDETRQAIIDNHLELEMKNAESTGLEMNSKGVNKGTGLKELCQHLGISIEETIVVGDADNDKEALEVAGLSIAMDNALDSVKDMCDVIVSDNDHDGCAEAITKYLLD